MSWTTNCVCSSFYNIFKFISLVFKDVVETDKQKKSLKGELMANDQDAMEVSFKYDVNIYSNTIYNYFTLS